MGLQQFLDPTGQQLAVPDRLVGQRSDQSLRAALWTGGRKPAFEGDAFIQGRDDLLSEMLRDPGEGD
ncbi:hypothetical protein ACUN22_35950 [Streptomyces anulatus]|uniref:hypothetical protein n=1 Tax=Streptomyces anulatus TaxID=1892 RepID=UPI00403E19DA